MLQVEWWGALLLLWSAICYFVLAKGTTFTWTGDTISLHLTYLAGAAVIVGYFYPLNATLLKQLYIGAWVVSVLAIATNYFWPERPDDEAAEPKADPEGAAASEDEEELTPLWSFLGDAIVWGPIIISILMGGFKSYGLAHSLGWLA